MILYSLSRLVLKVSCRNRKTHHVSLVFQIILILRTLLKMTNQKQKLKISISMTKRTSLPMSFKTIILMHLSSQHKNCRTLSRLEMCKLLLLVILICPAYLSLRNFKTKKLCTSNKPRSESKVTKKLTLTSKRSLRTEVWQF